MKMIAIFAVLVLSVLAVMPVMAQTTSTPPSGFCAGSEGWFIPASASPQGGDCGSGNYIEQFEGTSTNFGSIGDALNAHAGHGRTIWFQPAPAQPEQPQGPATPTPPSGFCTGTEGWFIPASASPQGGDCGQGVYVEQFEGTSTNFGSIGEALNVHSGHDRTIWFQPAPTRPAPEEQASPQPVQPQAQQLAVQASSSATKVDVELCGGEQMFANASAGLNIRSGTGTGFAKTGSYPFGVAIQIEACFDTQTSPWRFWAQTPRGFVAAVLLSNARPMVESTEETEDIEITEQGDAVDIDELAELPESAIALFAPFCEGRISMQTAVLPLDPPCQSGSYYAVVGNAILMFPNWGTVKNAGGVSELWHLPQ